MPFVRKYTHHIKKEKELEPENAKEVEDQEQEETKESIVNDGNNINEFLEKVAEEYAEQEEYGDEAVILQNDK